MRRTYIALLAGILVGGLFVATVQALQTGSSPPLSANNTWTGDQHFSSGRPWVDVRAFCTTVDGSTDNTACLQAAINHAASVKAGLIYLPNGHYCIKTNGGIAATEEGVRIIGASQGSSFLDTCGAKTNLLTMNGDSQTLENVVLNGPGLGASPSQNTLTLESKCVRCKVINNTITGGFYSILDKARYSFVEYNRVSNAYGSALLEMRAGGFSIRNQLDQNWPVSFPGARSVSSIAAWAANTSYSVGAVVSLNGYYIQSATAGKSGASAPALANYGSDIHDGNVVWRLAYAVNCYGLIVDTGAFASYIFETDTTGPFTAGIAIQNNFGGKAPATISIVDGTIGQTLLFGIKADAGSQLFVKGNQIQSVLETGGLGIYLNGAWGGDATILGNAIFATGTGIGLFAGMNATVEGNQIFGNGTGIEVGPGISKFVIANNLVGSSANFGANTNAITVEPGSSDHYNIVNNILAGTAKGITDGGAGKNKTISGNH